jgi:hypothetical protein
MQKETSNPGCLFVKRNLFLYHENGLNETEAGIFDDHVRTCADCSKIVSEFRQFASIIDKRKTVEPNPFMGTRILQSMENHLESQKNSTPVFRRILRPVSVSLLLLIAVITGFTIAIQRETKLLKDRTHQADIQVMKSGLGLHDFLDDDKTVNDIH